MQLQGSNKQVYSQLADSIRWSILLTDYNFSLQGGGGGAASLGRRCFAEGESLIYRRLTQTQGRVGTVGADPNDHPRPRLTLLPHRQPPNLRFVVRTEGTCSLADTSSVRLWVNDRVPASHGKWQKKMMPFKGKHREFVNFAKAQRILQNAGKTQGIF